MILKNLKDNFSDLSETVKKFAKTLHMTTGTFTAVSAAITVVAIAFATYKKEQEEARQAAIASIDAYKEEQSLLKEQTEKYKKLTEEIENGNLSVKETVEKKEELLAIQNNLIDTFGDEAEGIDLVNGKYQEQLELLEKISHQNAANIVAENKGKFEDAKAALEKDRNYSVGRIANWSKANPLSEQSEKLIDFIESYSDLFTITNGSATGGGQTAYWADLTVKANVEDADKVLHGFAEDLRKFGDENNIDVSGILSSVSTQLNKTWTEELKDYKEIYDEYATALVMANDQVRSKYKEAVDAVEAYNNAIATGDGYEAAKTNLENVISAVKELTSGLEDGEEMWYVFQEIFGNKEQSRESRVANIKEQFGLHHNDKTLETFFVSENVDIEWFERIASVSKTATEAIRTYRTEVEKAKEYDTFTITSEQAEAIEKYKSTVSSVKDILENIRDASPESQPVLVDELLEAFGDSGLNMNSLLVDAINRGGEVTESDMMAIADAAWNALASAMDGSDEANAIIQAIRDKYANFDFTETLTVNKSAYDELFSIYNKIQKGSTFTQDELQPILNKYSDLEGELVKVGNKYAIQEDALVSLINKYGELTNAAITSEIARVKSAKATNAYIGMSEVALDEAREGADDYTLRLIEDAEAFLKLYGEGYVEYLETLMESILDDSSTFNEPEIFDWYETAIDNLTTKIDELGDRVNDTYLPWSRRNAELGKQMELLTDKANILEGAKTSYEEQMDKVADDAGLSADDIQKITQGYWDYGNLTLGIEKLNPEDDAKRIKAIQEYMEWYQKWQEANSELIATNNQLNDSEAAKFNNIQTQYDTILADFENQANLIEAQLAGAQAKGHLAVQDYYESLKGIKSSEIETLEKQIADLNAQFESSGVQEGTEAWANFTNQLAELRVEAQNAKNDLIDLNNSARQAEWDLFDFNRENAQRVMGESDFLIDLLDGQKLVNDDGSFTDAGVSSIGLHGANFNGYLEESYYYAKKLAEIERQLADPANADDSQLIKRRNEILEQQQEMILAAESEKEAIADLVREGYEAQKNALKELIDEYTEALDAEKNLYDQQKKTADQTKRIAELRKMIASAAGDTSEETRAQVQKWQVELNEANSDLESDQYDQYIADQKAVLSEIMEMYSEVLDTQAEDTEKLFQEAMLQSKQNSAMINQTINGVSEKVGYDINTGLSNMLKDGALNTNLTEVKERVDNHGASISDGVEQLDENVIKNNEKADNTNDNTKETADNTEALLEKFETIVQNTKSMVENTTGVSADVKTIVTEEVQLADKMDSLVVQVDELGRTVGTSAEGIKSSVIQSVGNATQNIVNAINNIDINLSQASSAYNDGSFTSVSGATYIPLSSAGLLSTFESLDIGNHFMSDAMKSITEYATEQARKVINNGNSNNNMSFGDVIIETQATDANSLINELQNNRKIQNAIADVVASGLGSGSSMAHYKY